MGKRRRVPIPKTTPFNTAKLRMHRERLNISKTELSRQLGYDEEYINLLEKGYCKGPPITTIQDLLNMLNMDAFTILEFLKFDRFNKRNTQSFLYYCRLNNDDPHQVINSFMKLYADNMREKYKGKAKEETQEETNQDQ